MQKYETTLVIDSLQKSEEMQKVVTKIQSFIKNNGGEIHHTDEWGKKRLAYEINRKQYGNYYQIFFESPSTLPALLEREYRLEDSILRYLTLISEYDDAEIVEESSETKASEAAPAAPKTPEEPVAAKTPDEPVADAEVKAEVSGEVVEEPEKAASDE